MEPKKIIKFGNSSYVITLPHSWLEKNSLSKGDFLQTIEKDNSLIFYINKDNKSECVATINVDKKPLKLLNKELLSYYLKNYKTIELEGEKILEILDDIRRLKEKVSSLEITEIQKNKVILQDLTSQKDININKLIEDIIKMEYLFFDELIHEIDYNKYQFLLELDTNINKLSFLAHKSINYHLNTWENPDIVKDSISYWRIIGAFETSGDILKRIAQYLKNNENSNKPEISDLITKLKEYYIFITNFILDNRELNKNLEIYLDKKQTILREIENSKEKFSENINLFLVLSQLFKDIIGKLDTIVISIIDINTKENQSLTE